MIRTLVFALLSQLVALPLAAAPVPIEVRVIRQGWTASASPQEVAAALALRLPSLRVLVVDEAGAVDVPDVCLVVLDATETGAPRLSVRCPAAAPVVETLPAAPAVELARLTAVEVAILVEALTAPRTEPPTAPTSPPPEPPLPELVAARRRVAPARPEVGSPVRAAFRLAAGLAVAPELPDTTNAVTVDARVFLAGHAHLTAGATLAGPFEQTFAGETDAAADRSLWLGAGYRVPLGPLSVDASLALAYTIPLLDAQGEAEGELREEDVASRFGLRGGAALGWALNPSFALVVELAGRVSFLERGIVAGRREAIGIGTLVVASTAGLELRL